VFRRILPWLRVATIGLLACSMPLRASDTRELAERNLFVLQQKRFEFLREPKAGTAEKIAYRKLFGETDALVMALDDEDSGRETLMRWLRLEGTLATNARSKESNEKLLSLSFLAGLKSVPGKPDDRKAFLTLLSRVQGRLPAADSEEGARLAHEIDAGSLFLDLRF
jgi:hypothetical protein